MTQFTDEDFVTAIHKVVAERGEDFTYPDAKCDPITSRRVDDDWWRDGACVYSHPDGTSACIVGAALYELDPALVPPYDSNGQSASDVLEPLGFSDAVQRAADEAQTHQDDGVSWGHALYEFDYAYRRQTGDA